jgi:hypothetical protein
MSSLTPIKVIALFVNKEIFLTLITFMVIDEELLFIVVIMM